MGPLTGLKLIEIKGIGPGPYAGQVLADLGAEIIVVERASKTNSIAAPSVMDVNSRGKKSIAIDLRKPEGLETLLKLVEQADGIYEGNRPGVAEKLGFGPDVCLERNPKIIYGRMTGWGQHGPLAHAAGHDYNYISLSGAAAAIGTADKPVPPLNLVGDYAAGSLFLVIGMLSALLESKTSGQGQVVDAAITDGTAHLMSMFHTMDKLGQFNPARETNMLDGGTPFYGSYETSDGKHLSVAPLEPQFFAEMISTLGLPERFVAEQYNVELWPELKSTLTATFKTKTRDEWAEIFEGSDACVAGLLTLKEAASHPHNKARGTYIELNGQMQPAPAPRFSRSQSDIPALPSAEGADTKAVLSDWGFDSDAIASLEQAGVFT
ncbi:Acetyl-CoA:oxalate CoA-transferase [Zhongshania aliphaticivorans]|uniref:Acetyl-CoA:oxalate CoA-transferase n=1 Tax=Zhongshania aliphaticivorans TaxID=1470434 RepID=A0A5S9N4M4_9GAMM|nr:CaiB/BaiF CoA-transferase family protein [Zhongshania aliphaticivorans]CAA0081679.1 Acetyl-CoA:oxalate CoA-transferase [Zhongshania aliphaticivorans]CAA0084728.1 Acetyl-CoA:oxalate CoA-transferase [Zhongshania aliphaticivorans]